MKILKRIHENRFLIRKRIIGLTLGVTIIWLFSSNVENDCVYVITHELKNNHIQTALISPVKEKESIKKEVKPIEKKISFLDKRYSNIKYYGEHPYFRGIIERDAKLIYDLCKKENINPSVTMAQYILESYIVEKGVGRVSEMGLTHNNYFSVKHKGDDPYYSDAYKALLSEASVDKIYWQKDDDIENGKLVESPFYKFKTKWYGIRAGIGFIGDRVRSDYPQWQHFKSIDPTDTKAWAYGIYKAGYAKKDSKVPYDKKIMRLINEYEIESIMAKF